MAYLLNSYDLLTKYGLRAGHAPNSNLSLQGCFDMPSRIGDTFHSWGDEDGVEPFAASGDIFFGGRDINFMGSIAGTRPVLNSNLKSLYTDITAATGLSQFSTPYGDYSGIVRTIDPEYLHGGCSVALSFREPVVNLSGGTLPASGVSDNTFDSIPMLSFGVYHSGSKEIHSLPEFKDMQFTKYGLEGYQITKRKNRVLEFDGFIIGSSLSDFQDKIKALYKLFSAPGLRTVKLNSEISVSCFAVNGFTVDNVFIYNSGMAGKFKISLIVVSVTDLIQGIPATPPTDAELLVRVAFGTYGSVGGKVYELSGGEYIPDTGIDLLETEIIWKNVGGNNNDGPLNRCGVWSTLSATPGQYIGFGMSVTIPVSKTYYICVGADNYMEISVDDVVIKSFPSGDELEDHFRSWHMLPVWLTAGVHLIHIRGYNNVGPASIGAEIYNATLAELQAMATVEALEAVTIFSTKDFIGTYVQEGNFGTGWTCPDGWTLINIEGVYTCVIVS